MPPASTNRDTFLTRIDGLIYGDDPQQGVIEGNTFIHPDLRLTFTAPNGFYMVNGTDAVSINGQSGQAPADDRRRTTAISRPTSARCSSRSAASSAARAAELAAHHDQRACRRRMASARVNTGQSKVDVVVFAYEFSRNQAFHFATITPAGRVVVFNPMFNSMRRISAERGGAGDSARARRGDRAAATDTVQSLASADGLSATRRSSASGCSTAWPSNAQVVPGEKYKIVVRGAERCADKRKGRQVSLPPSSLLRITLAD